MNIEKLKTHISATYFDDINPVLADDKSNLSAFYCADVVGNKRFVTNFGGYPRSDVAIINNAANELQQANLLAQLIDYTPDSNPNAGLTDVEILKGLKSKYCQTASEQVGWLEHQITERDNRRLADQLKSEKTIEFKETDNPVENA